MSDSPVAILHNTSGTEIGTGANPVRTDPTGSTTQPVSGPLTDTQLRATAVPVSASSLPLPSGAATAAKQPAIGTAGTPSADVVSVQGVSGGTPIPISGSVTATPGVIPNATDTTGTISALNGTVQAAIQGYSSCAVVVTGTWVATLVFEFSHDGGTTWAAGTFVKSPATATPIPDIVAFLTANTSAQCVGMGPTTHVRIRAAAYTSGTVNIRLVFADSPPSVLTGLMAVRQSVTTSIYNNSTANLAAGASFTGTAEASTGAAGIRVSVKCDQPILVKVQQSTDGTNWDYEDQQTFQAEQGDGRVFQSVAVYFRVVATNLGPSTSTYFRLQTVMGPIVEAVPRSLTPSGKLKLSTQTVGWSPDPANHPDIAIPGRALLQDVTRSLMIRGQVLTDEASFREDFPGSQLYSDETGTFYFTNGSDVVIGSGTAFSSELDIQHYLKLSTDADSVYAGVSEIVNDEFLILSEPYAGTTGSGTGRSSHWKPGVGAGGTLTVTGSELQLASGTTSGSDVEVWREADYLPFVIEFRAKVSQRIANQNAHIGLADAEYGSANNQVFVAFDGTSNTTLKFQTSSDAATIEETTVTIPDGGLSTAYHFYRLEITAQRCILFIDDVMVAEHKTHIPGPYSTMFCYVAIKNTGTPASSTTLTLDSYLFNNFDRVEISTTQKGDPASVKELRASVPASSSVSAAVADTQLLAPNLKRLGAAVFNDSIATLYLKLGSGASTTSFTVALGRYEYYEVPFGFTGRVNGYWSAATGSARVTELT